ncbi:hypothetical protein HYW74_02905 [Candidatus Pacearchaeota archaeon]|nr:hypothetical protein [Candidatus Pacearchaeota archaeon]
MDLEEFLAKETQILDKMQEAWRNVSETGLVSKVPQDGTMAGYLVYLTFQEDRIRPIAEMSKRINRTLNGKSIIYQLENIHQTIADYEVRVRENIKPEEFYPDKDILGTLAYASLESCPAMDLTSPFTIFGNYIYNSDSVVLRPQTATCNRENYGLIESFAENAAKEGLDVRKAWGRHITVSRFTEDVPNQDLGNFIKLMKNTLGFPNVSPDGDPVFANALNVGYFTLNKQGFSLYREAEFPLEN